MDNLVETPRGHSDFWLQLAQNDAIYSALHNDNATNSDTESSADSSIFSAISPCTANTEALTWGTTDDDRDPSIQEDPGIQDNREDPSIRDDRGHSSVNSNASLDNEHSDSHYSVDQQLNELPYTANMENLPTPGTRSQLPCIFRWDGCDIKYDLREKQKWKLHSLDHLGCIPPPTAIICFFKDCGEAFCHEDRIVNWDRFMEHMAEHTATKLNRYQALLGGGQLDANDEARFLEKLYADTETDVNFRQYVISHGHATRVGLDIDINPNPPSELDRIPRGFMNRMPLAYGGQRVMEVVLGPFEDQQEHNLDTRSADTMCVPRQREGRRNQEPSTFMAARTAGNYGRPPHQESPPVRRRNGCRPGPSELIIRL